jgi:hypothetical protein
MTDNTQLKPNEPAKKEFVEEIFNHILENLNKSNI